MTIIPQPALRLCLVLISSLTLAACTTTHSAAYPKGEMTMTQIYDQTTSSNTSQNNDDSNIVQVRQQLGVENMPQTSYASYTRDANNEVNNLFKRMPNPQIPVYIYPHLASINDDDLPVPGYSTVFSLFSHDEYAMPSEQY